MWDLAPENTKVYLCGHPGMIENVNGIVKRHGWQEDSIKEEAFFVPRDETAGLEDSRKTAAKG
jgi:ferredoxin-NADP reductase